MIVRDQYLEQLRGFIGKEQVKILTGIRRCGKSTVLKLLHKELKNTGVKEEDIIYINYESFTFSFLQAAQALHAYVMEKASKKDKTYLLIDEIQEVKDWEKAIKSLLVDIDVDIYLTGSNAHLLSSELSTYLAGRYIEIPVYTLSFAEFLQFNSEYRQDTFVDRYDAFEKYLQLGGFPVLHIASYTTDQAYKVVYDIYSSVLLRDTVQRYKIRDVELLERIVKYAFDNMGNTFSGKNVADYFKSQQRRVDLNTVYNYLYSLESAFILYRTSRYDIKGREILKTQEKYYLSDVALLYATMGFKNRKINAILENIVFLELKRREYKVYIGKIGKKEIDFIAEKRGKKLYFQVAYKLEQESTIEREFSGLLSIKDQFPKYVLSMDKSWEETVNGVQHYNIADFLLADFY